MQKADKKHHCPFASRICITQNDALFAHLTFDTSMLVALVIFSMSAPPPSLTYSHREHNRVRLIIAKPNTEEHLDLTVYIYKLCPKQIMYIGANCK